jgi:hypothetical protein
LRLVFVVIMRSVYQTEQPLPTKHVVPKSGSISNFIGPQRLMLQQSITRRGLTTGERVRLIWTAQ